MIYPISHSHPKRIAMGRHCLLTATTRNCSQRSLKDRAGFRMCFDLLMYARLTISRWLVLSFILCVFFTVSMIYAVELIEDYNENRSHFLLVSWLLFLVPSAVIAFFVVSPVPRGIRRFRHRLSTKRPCQYFKSRSTRISANEKH